MAARAISEKGMNKKTRYYINAVIGIGIMFLFGTLPTFGPVTELGMKYLGIFIGLIWLWATCDMSWPVFAAFTAMVFLQCCPVTTILAGFSNYTVMMTLLVMLACFPFAEKSGVFSYIAKWMLSLPFLKGHPWRLTAFLILLSCIGTLLQSGMVALLLVWSLTYKACDAVNMPHSCKWAGAVVCGTCWTMLSAAWLFPFSSSSLLVLGVFQGAVADLQYNFLKWMVFAGTIYAIIFVLYLLAMKFVIKVDVTPLKSGDFSGFFSELEPMSKEQKHYTTALLAFIICMIVVGISASIPANPVTGFFARFGLLGICFVFVILALIWRKPDGSSVMSIGYVMNTTMWDAIMVVWCGMVFAGVLTSPETGISTLLAQILGTVFAGKSELFFLVIMCMVALVMTNLMNNAVVLMLVFSFAYTIAMQFGINVEFLIMLIMFSTQFAILMPGSSIGGALLYGNAEELGRNNCLLWGTTAMIIGAVAIVIMIFLGMVFY